MLTYSKMRAMFSEGSSIAIATEDSDHFVAQLALQISAKELLNKRTLVSIVSRHYHYPEEHRVVIWRYLFRLPMNEKKYALYSTQPVHPSIRNLPITLPVRYSMIANRLTRILSSLCYWHPPLGECDWLPALVFPFLRIFERDSVISFEFIVTIITNWCSEWLHFVPNPPLTIISRIDRIARSFGGEAPISVAWPALRSLFGEVATTETALMLFDNIISARPVFLEYLVASFALIQGEKIVTEGVADHEISFLLEKPNIDNELSSLRQVCADLSLFSLKRKSVAPAANNNTPEVLSPEKTKPST